MGVSRTISTTTILFFSLLFASCGGCALVGFGTGGAEVTLLAYNVENLFDDVHNGTEYREYDPASGEWNTELFHIKMQHIAEVLRTAVSGGADIVVLEEVENANVVESLNENYLKGLGYRAFAAEGGRTAVAVAVLSRLPVAGLRLHHLVSDTEEPLRDIMELRVDCAGKPLVVFANHWKSKLGSAESTEAARRAAAGLVARRLRAIAAELPGCAVVVAGDLNENWDEYARTGGRYLTALMPRSAGEPPQAESRVGGESLYIAASPAAARPGSAAVGSAQVVLYSPWSEGNEQGSYCYAGSWETIDHTLVGPALLDGEGLEYRSFNVVRPSFLLDGNGFPASWNSDRAAGYSDHLPILLTLKDVS